MESGFLLKSIVVDWLVVTHGSLTEKIPDKVWRKRNTIEYRSNYQRSTKVFYTLEEEWCVKESRSVLLTTSRDGQLTLLCHCLSFTKGPIHLNFYDIFIFSSYKLVKGHKTLVKFYYNREEWNGNSDNGSPVKHRKKEDEGTGLYRWFGGRVCTNYAPTLSDKTS